MRRRQQSVSDSIASGRCLYPPRAQGRLSTKVVSGCVLHLRSGSLFGFDCVASALVPFGARVIDVVVRRHIDSLGLHSNSALGSFLVVHLVLHEDCFRVALCLLLLKEELLVANVL